MKLARQTILASEIRGCRPELALELVKPVTTKKEVSMFIKLAVCKNLEAMCPQWVRRCSPKQRAMLCAHAAKYTPIKTGKEFWGRLKLLVNGSSKFRIIDG
jgi:hypothetical protein